MFWDRLRVIDFGHITSCLNLKIEYPHSYFSCFTNSFGHKILFQILNYLLFLFRRESRYFCCFPSFNCIQLIWYAIIEKKETFKKYQNIFFLIFFYSASNAELTEECGMKPTCPSSKISHNRICRMEIEHLEFSLALSIFNQYYICVMIMWANCPEELCVWLLSFELWRRVHDHCAL